MPIRIPGREKSTISARPPLPHPGFRFPHLHKFMKTSWLVIVLLVSSLAGLWAQVPATNANQALNQIVLPAPTPYTIVTNDANSRVWERTVYERGTNGIV